MIKVDARGLSCPQPVLVTKKAISSGGSGVEVIVDNETAKENVKRFLSHSGYSVSVDQEGELLILKGNK
ncbi:sulfurtransferase TusA family protein [Fusibacter tunisiensis]|uniref:TusA-related sulfurtransferase n=1 Tax=Fusibacter tunisiensis TaxID=1008308 RepID=A0ABS2MSL2_9FIRM|nr:sulfurtransferase TusA family protein [Fusibacter tunisiensis]MBM7562423.1 TusA-related sulfurtransferase [Fusibacter tunisiensis]